MELIETIIEAVQELL